MTEDRAEKITESLLKAFELKDWWVSFRGEHHHGDESLSYVGQCEHRLDHIVLTKNHLASDTDAKILETITHEITHALLGARCNSHDATFRAKHKAVHERALHHLAERCDCAECDLKTEQRWLKKQAEKRNTQNTPTHA
jgi:hypothetical protein